MIRVELEQVSHDLSMIDGNLTAISDYQASDPSCCLRGGGGEEMHTLVLVPPVVPYALAYRFPWLPPSAHPTYVYIV